MRKKKCTKCGATVLHIPVFGRKHIACNPQKVRFDPQPKNGKQYIVTSSGAVIRCKYTEGLLYPEGYVPHKYTCLAEKEKGNRE